MTYRLIQAVDGQFVTTDFTAANVLAGMEVRGFAFQKLNTNPSQRAELQGEPKFAGLCGPMYGGDGILRYEDAAAYAAASC